MPVRTMTQARGRTLAIATAAIIITSSGCNVIFPYDARRGNAGVDAGSDAAGDASIPTDGDTPVDAIGGRLHLVKDINPGPAPDLWPPVEISSNTVLYLASTPEHGVELWRAPSEPGGVPTMLRDIRPGERGADISFMKAIDGVLYFVADDGTHGRELWRSDGSSEGTYMISDICAGACDGVRASGFALTPYDGAIYFAADDGRNGSELWKYDGVETVTMVADIADRLQDGLPRNVELFEALGWLFFAGKSADAGVEVWRSDGTADGTIRLADINPGPNSSNPTGFIATDTRVYFLAESDETGREPWVSDGTPDGTRRVADVYPGPESGATSLAIFQGRLVIGGADANNPGAVFITNEAATEVQLLAGSSTTPDMTDPPSALFATPTALYIAGQGLYGPIWRSDGTGAGTQALTDPDVHNALIWAANFVAVEDRVYFTARRWMSTRDELWVDDRAGASPSPVNGGLPSVAATTAGFHELLGKLVFAGDTAAAGQEIWATDGTPAGTLLLKDIYAGPQSSGISATTKGSGVIYFYAYDGMHVGLWKSDGSIAGTVRMTTVDVQSADSDPDGFVQIAAHEVLFSAAGLNGRELWRTDGTAAATNRVADIYPGASGSWPLSLTAFDGRAVFTATDPERGREPWISDGTSGGTRLLRDIFPDTSSSMIFGYAVLGGKVLFGANGPGIDYLWSWDGSAVDPAIVAPVAIRSPLTLIGGSLFFYVIDGRKLWRSDGTPDGTVAVSESALPTDNPTVTELPVSANGVIYFGGAAPDFGAELWKIDASTGAMVMVKDIFAGIDDSRPSDFAALGGSVIFAATDATGGRELWRSDGTADGTVRLKDIRQGPQSSFPGPAVVLEGRAIFAANDGVSGRELWVTDGTTEKTELLADIYPGPISSLPDHLFRSGNLIYFSARDPDHGVELWQTDGTTAGTKWVADINPDGDSNPHAFFDYNGALLFAADNGHDGAELWIYQP